MLMDKDIYVFVRFGGLGIKAQKGYVRDGELTYHSPPASRGFYAMPKIAQESFLIGCLNKTQPENFGKNEVTKDKLRLLRKEFRKTTGEIWHHLVDETSHKDVLMRHGDWIKTDIKVWAKAFSKMSTISRYGRQKYDLDNGYTKPFPTNGIVGNFSKDHCEVFFDNKI